MCISFATNPIHRHGHDGLIPFTDRIRAAVLVLFFLIGASVTVIAQTATQQVVFTAWTTNLYTAVNYSGTHTNGFQLITRHDTNVVTVNVTGLPLGASILLTTNGLALPAVVVPSATNQITTNIMMIVAITNVTAGDYPLEMTASGSGFETRTQQLVLHVGDLLIWRATDTNNNAWSVNTNWGPAFAPAAGSNVKFEDDGVTTNFIDSSITLGRLSYVRFANGPNPARVTIIAPGATLLVTNGFIANSESDGNNRSPVTVFIGTNGASLMVSNANKDFAVNNFSTGTGSTFDMGGLDNFVADVNRFGIADVTLITEGSFGAQHVRFLSLAKTNIIRAHYIGSTDGLQITNAIQFWNHEDEPGAIQNGSQYNVYMGISNVFLADGIIIGKGRVGAQGNVLQFSNNAAIRTNNPTAIFHNINGGRMSFFGLGVDAGTNRVSGQSCGNADFSLGTVDILADTMWLARDRLNVTTNAGARVRGALTFSKGVVDVNTVRLGFQQYTNDTRHEARITVNGGTLVVNSLLDMAYTSGEYSAGTLAQGFSELLVNSNGVARVNTITVGGISRQTTNSIVLTTESTLIVSNTVGAPDARLGRLSMTDAQLTLHLNDANTNVFVKNFISIAGPIGNKINLATVPTFTSYPTQIALISYEAVTFNISRGSLPPGLDGFLTNNTANSTIDIVLTTNTPKSLVWRGNVNGNWNSSTTNWVTTGLTPTNFSDGDFVRFDDTALNSTVNVETTVRPAQSPVLPGIVVSNSVLNYSFTGGGTVQGAAQALKQGAGTWTINSVMESPLLIEQGTVNGAGTIGSAVLQPGSLLNFSGNISAGLVTAGTASTSGGITGSLTVQAGGILTNSGNIAVSSITFQTNALLVNLGNMTNLTTWSVPSNTVLANWSYILQSATLNIDRGTLTGSGLIEHPSAVTAAESRVALNDRSTFTPSGSSTIGETRIYTRLDLNAGSTTIFDVDIAGGSNDMVVADSLNFSAPGGNPARIVITNIGGGSFGAGQSFQLFTNSFGSPFAPDNTNTIVFLMQPVSPGLGLVWNTSELRTNGILSIGIVITMPTNITFGITTTTNTNTLVTTEFLGMSWPEDHLGWRLEAQTNTLQVGISTNWSTVLFSHLSNHIDVPFVLTNPAVFYRLAHP